MIRLLLGDCRDTLRTLDPGSVQCVATSPPYYGLRDYGLPPLVWGGDLEHEHEWLDATWRNTRLNDDTAGSKQRSNNGSLDHDRRERPGATCACGAWLGSLGLEPTPELWIEHLVEVFRAVRRVLRDDGTVWLNIGDSYAGSGKGPSNSLQSEASQIGNRNRGIPAVGSASTLRNDGRAHKGPYDGERLTTPNYGRTGPVPGYKAKDLMLLPARLALALQGDGWYVRSQIPWLKRNSMPESVTDRPASSVEYVYLLSKNARYYYDADAVRTAHSDTRVVNGKFKGSGGVNREEWVPDTQGWRSGGKGLSMKDRQYNPAGRNRRNSDWFMESWQGLLTDEDDEPLALVVNPAPYRGAHFATFPPKLVEPMIKASTSERGQCPTCGAPWVRSSESVSNWQERRASGATSGNRSAETVDQKVVHGAGMSHDLGGGLRQTTGWRPSCAHLDLEPVPQTILDPFGGSGCTGLVADRLGRNAILCELSAGYGDQSVARVVGDAPLFVQMERLL